VGSRRSFCRRTIRLAPQQALVRLRSINVPELVRAADDRLGFSVHLASSRRGSRWTLEEISDRMEFALTRCGVSGLCYFTDHQRVGDFDRGRIRLIGLLALSSTRRIP